jgi:RNA polymerase sigma-70 factor (ECF subfamily)
VNADSDWQQIAKAQEGDMTAFTNLVERWESPLIRFCERMVGSREDAEEIAQESFVRVYRNLGRLKPSAKFSTFLFGIARNLSLNTIRDSRRRKAHITQALGVDEGLDNRLLGDERSRPDREIRLAEIGRTIERGIEMLPNEYREAIILREFEGMSYEDISRIIKCPKGTVKSRIARARLRLRKYLQDAGEEL